MRLIGLQTAQEHCILRSEGTKRCLLAVVAVVALTVAFLYCPKHATNVADVFYEPIYFTPLEKDNDPRDAYPLDQLTASDRDLLINVTDFHYTIRPAPPRECDTRRPFVLALIHSAPLNYERRALLRNTWLSQRDEDFKALFLLGHVSSRFARKILQKESELYGDLVQGNFIDSYQNMTYKHVMALKYATYQCPGARYVMKTDDDIIVNLEYLLKLLRIMSPYGVRNLLLCSMKGYTMVMRSYRSKWRVSFGEYPFYSYPKYCSGGAVLYSPDVVFRLYKQVQNLPFFWIDDVHVTGTAAKLAQIRHMHFLPSMSPFLLLS